MELRRFDPANPPADYRTWVLTWRRVYRAFSLYRRFKKLEGRVVWSRFARKAERGKDGLELALAVTQAKLEPLPPELTAMRLYTFEREFHPHAEFAREMLQARVFGKIWYWAQKAGVTPPTSS